MLRLRSYVEIGNQCFEGLLVYHFLFGEIIAFDVRPCRYWSELVYGQKVGEMDVFMQMGLDLELVKIVFFASWLEEKLKIFAEHLLVLFDLKEGVFIFDEKLKTFVTHLDILHTSHNVQKVTLYLHLFISTQLALMFGQKSEKLD